jgi:uncharacterized repeat protein (TIGR01451 family)
VATRHRYAWIFPVVLVAGLLVLPAVPALAAPADLSVTKVDSPDPVVAGSNLTYTIAVANLTAAAATSVTLSDTLPANTTFLSLTSPAGWTCTTPAFGGTGTVNCTIATLPANGSGSFTLVVNVNAATPNGTIVSNTASVTSTDDPAAGNNSATATTTVSSGANLLVLKSDSPDPAVANGNITYVITVRNDGPLAATSATLTDVIPANTTFVSLAAAAGWTCTTPAFGGTGTVSCTNPSVAALAVATFTLVVKVNAGVVSGTVIMNTATVVSATTDPVTTNNAATTTTTIRVAAAACTITGTNQSETINGTAGDDVICGGNGRDTINGLGGNDIILGQNGKDTLNGGDGNDTVMGGNAKDVVVGGTGIDALRGGNGADRLNAQDGAAGDSIDGGNGPDTCLTDVGDVKVNCP